MDPIIEQYTNDSFKDCIDHFEDSGPCGPCSKCGTPKEAWKTLKIIVADEETIGWIKMCTGCNSLIGVFND
jgi:hypothetical protein